MKEAIKFLLAPVAYLVLGPLIGVMIARSRAWQRGILCLMVFMTSLFPTKFTMMVDSIEWYRGHTKGFECSLIECLAIALILASAMNPRRPFKWLPPGIWIYLIYCLLSCLSIVVAIGSVGGSTALREEPAGIFRGVFVDDAEKSHVGVGARPRGEGFMLLDARDAPGCPEVHHRRPPPER